MGKIEINNIYNMDCIEGMKYLPDNYIDLTVTSPPYDNLRSYDGKSKWDFENTAKELYRITKEGGVVVWVVGDQTKNGTESGTSFKQALYFKQLGFNLHDTMIYKKHSPHPPNVRYWQVFEYMFVFSKGRPKTFNPLMQEKLYKNGRDQKSTVRDYNGNLSRVSQNALYRREQASKKATRIMDNIWNIPVGNFKSTNDKYAYIHPAIFPEKLALMHILSWSNPNDIVFDPFLGSGTTAKMAILNGRKYLGFEINKDYYDVAIKRATEAVNTKKVMSL